MSEDEISVNKVEAKEENIVDFNDWIKTELRVGLIQNIEDIEGKDKLYKLRVSFGELGERTILAGLKQYYVKEDLLDKKVIFVFNLAAKKLAGIESQGMILAAKNDANEYKIFFADVSIKEGTRLE